MSDLRKLAREKMRDHYEGCAVQALKRGIAADSFGLHEMAERELERAGHMYAMACVSVWIVGWN